MTNYSLAELTTRMHGKSITLGWDAVVFMNRAKVNSLLEQQYITRFNKDSFMKRISGAPAMVPDGKEYLELSGLILSQPRLSFEKASLRDSRVTATMDIVSGTVSYVRQGTNQLPGGVLYSYVVSAHQRRTLTMDIDLTASQGAVNEQGQVIIDIGNAYNCRCNLVNEEKSQELLGDFFKALFLAQKPEDRIYVLGMLDLRDVDLLAPRSFKIRTMATDEGKAATSDDYGEGAVVLLVRTKGNPKEGDDPSEGALDYLIPNDRDAKGKALYSGSLVLASRVVFDWYVQRELERQIGNGLRFKRVSESNHMNRTLRATFGGFDIPGVSLQHIEGQDDYTITNLEFFKIEFSAAVDADALNVLSSESGHLAIRWQSIQTQKFNLKAFNPFAIPQTRNVPFNIYVAPAITIDLEAVVDPVDNSVTLLRTDASIVDCKVDLSEYRAIWRNFPDAFERGLVSDVVTPIQEAFEVFEKIDIPEINVLAISNLLFPEKNALQLSEARLPGDLALFGQIDPKETTFTLDPLLPVIKAGQQQTFTIRQLGVRANDVTWSVRSIDGARAAGTIANGVYTAPAAQLLEGTAVRNVVTASYTDSTTGKPVTASAMVTIALAGVVVTPSMSLVDMSDRKSVTLQATTLGTGPFKWTSRGGPGTLVPSGDQAVYTAPTTALPEGTLQVALFDVEDTSTGEKTTATVLLRQGNFPMSIAPAFHPGLPPNASALLKAPTQVTPDKLKWEVVAGEGTIDPATGIFTAPRVITLPYSVVKVTLEGDFFDTLGYSIIHLSMHARQSNWFSLDTFDFEVMPVPSTVYANGLQQAKVVVRIKPTDVLGQPVELSPSEFASICLVSADQKIPLPEVGVAGVPEGEKWHYSETENDFYSYPHRGLPVSPDGGVPATLSIKEFFVQCHKVEDLRISARLRSDNFETFYSNPKPTDGEADSKVVRLIAKQPPEGGSIGGNVFTFGEPGTFPARILGGTDDEVLETLDYYSLKLLIEGQQVGIADIKHLRNQSMVKWESNTQLEDVHSITGYAKFGDLNAEGKTALRIDDILCRRMDGELPSQVVDAGHPVVKGEVLFSLHRRQYWRYDQYAKADFDAALNMIVYDNYGNSHSLVIGFDGINRNRLKILG